METYRPNKIKLYDFDTIMDFGRFRGNKVSLVFEVDFSYFVFCLREVNFFCISPNNMKKITEMENYNKKLDPSLLRQFLRRTISEKVIKSNLEKYQEWEGQQKNNERSAKDYSSYDEQDNYGHGDDTAEFDNWSGIEDYNDNLDIDQQGEAFYTTIEEEDREDPTEDPFYIECMEVLDSIIISNKSEIQSIFGIKFYDSPKWTESAVRNGTKFELGEFNGNKILLSLHFNKKLNYVYFDDNSSTYKKVANSIDEFLLILNFLTDVIKLGGEKLF